MSSTQGDNGKNVDTDVDKCQVDSCLHSAVKHTHDPHRVALGWVSWWCFERCNTSICAAQGSEYYNGKNIQWIDRVDSYTQQILTSCY